MLATVGKLYVLAQHVLRVGEMAHADDHDLAQPPRNRRLPSHRIGVIEPALGKRRSVEQHAIDVDQLPASAGAEFFDHIRKFRMVLLLDQGHSSHEYLYRVSGRKRQKLVRGNAWGNAQTSQEARWRVSRAHRF